MENASIIAILLVLVVIALLRVRKHFKGGCCGGSSVVRIKKKLDGPIINRKELVIEGMHCENCAARVENALNRMDGVSCRVNLRKKTAEVSCSAEVSAETLKKAVEELDYRVTAIR